MKKLEVQRLKQSQLKLFRLRLWQLLGSERVRCPFCGSTISHISEAVLDHDHRTGLIRGVLHRQCKQVEWRIRSYLNRLPKAGERQSPDLSQTQREILTYPTKLYKKPWMDETPQPLQRLQVYLDSPQIPLLHPRFEILSRSEAQERSALLRRLKTIKTERIRNQIKERLLEIKETERSRVTATYDPAEFESLFTRCISPVGFTGIEEYYQQPAEGATS